MATNQHVIATILAGGLLASPALAQTIPTVDAVSANVSAACSGNIALPAVQSSCLAAISGAIQVAGLYGGTGNLTPQIQIGFMLCQVANAQPAIRQTILDLIANSGIPTLGTGCSSALQTAAGGFGAPLNGVDPQDRDECRNGGWEAFGFRNQGQCIRFVNTGIDTRESQVITPG